MKILKELSGLPYSDESGLDITVETEDNFQIYVQVSIPTLYICKVQHTDYLLETQARTEFLGQGLSPLLPHGSAYALTSERDSRISCIHAISGSRFKRGCAFARQRESETESKREREREGKREGKREGEGEGEGEGDGDGGRCTNGSR